MLGIKINTHFDNVLVGTIGKIVVCSINKLYIKSIEQIILTDNIEPTIISKDSTELRALIEYVNDNQAPDFAWSLTGEMLYLFIKPKYQLGSVMIIAERFGIPVTDEDSVIDVPETHIDLLIRYALKESARLQGKVVPISLEEDIKQLEKQLKDNEIS